MKRVVVFLSALLILTGVVFAADGSEQQKFLKLNPKNEFKRYLGRPFSDVLKVLKITPGKGRISDFVIDLFKEGLSVQNENFGWELMKPPQIYKLYLGPELSCNHPEIRKIAVGLKSASFGVNEKGIIDFLFFQYNTFGTGYLQFANVYHGGIDIEPLYLKKDIIGLDSYGELRKDAYMQVYAKTDDNYLWFLIMTTTPDELRLAGEDGWCVLCLYALKKSTMFNYIKEIGSHLQNDHNFCMMWLDKLYDDGILTEEEGSKIKEYFGDKLYVTVTDEAGERIVSLPKIVTELQKMLDLSLYGSTLQSDKEELLKDIKK